MKKLIATSMLAVLATAFSCFALAEAQQHRRMGQYSGFEGNEQVLGSEVAEAIMRVSPTRGNEHSFEGREKELGLAVPASAGDQQEQEQDGTEQGYS